MEVICVICKDPKPSVVLGTLSCMCTICQDCAHDTIELINDRADTVPYECLQCNHVYRKDPIWIQGDPEVCVGISTTLTEIQVALHKFLFNDECLTHSVNRIETCLAQVPLDSVTTFPIVKQWYQYYRDFVASNSKIIEYNKISNWKLLAKISQIDSERDTDVSKTIDLKELVHSIHALNKHKSINFNHDVIQYKTFKSQNSNESVGYFELMWHVKDQALITIKDSNSKIDVKVGSDCYIANDTTLVQ